MAYAPHTNSDVQQQRRCGINDLPLLRGSFRFDSAKGAFFEYADRSPRLFPVDFALDYTFMIYTIDGPRLARVLHTVAHVVVDEGEHGPVVERWPLACHRVYPTEWVFA